MENSRRLPSYIVPMTEIVLGKLIIKPGEPVTINDDWQQEHISGSIVVDEDGRNGLIDNWIYLHSLLANSRLPVWMLHAKGEEVSSFQLSEFDNKGDARIVPRVINFDPNDLLPAVYLDYPDPPEMSYGQVYKQYLAQDEKYYSAIKNYLVAQDLNHHKRLRYIDNSYWQIVMLVSTLEALMPEPTFCEGKCENCGKSLNHATNNVGREWNDFLFSHIADNEICKQYRDILNEARWRIRNDTVHNGLAPGNEYWKPIPMPDGVTEYTTSKSLADYKTDRWSLESFIEQLTQICRYSLLDVTLKSHIYPPLKGIDVHSMTFTSTEPTATFNLDFGAN